MNIYEKMECDIFQNSLIDQSDLMTQAEDATADEENGSYVFA